MENFVTRHAPLVTSTLCGFDRLVLRGTLLPLMRDRGMHVLLARCGLRLLDFKDFVVETSDCVKEAALADLSARSRLLAARCPAPPSRGSTR